VTVLLDRIQAEPRPVDWRRAVLTGIAAALYGVGWFLAKDVRLLLSALAWCLYGIGRAAGWSFAAVRLGWIDARTNRPRI